MISNPQVSGLSEQTDSALERLLQAAQSHRGTSGDAVHASHGANAKNGATKNVRAPTSTTSLAQNGVRSDTHKNNSSKALHKQSHGGGSAAKTSVETAAGARAPNADPFPHNLVDVMKRIRTGRGSSEEVDDEANRTTGALSARTTPREDVPTGRSRPPEQQAHTRHTQQQRQGIAEQTSNTSSLSHMAAAAATNSVTAAATAVAATPMSLSEPVEMEFVADADLGAGAATLPELPELVHPRLRHALTQVMHITQLTRIQQLSWRAMCDLDTDVLLRSETGSGKTLAYALPLLHTLLTRCDASPIRREDGTRVIVMCPTRELVLQVTQTLSVLLRNAPFLTVGGIYGGENRHKEKARLRRGVPVLVGTPGRLLDHLRATAAFDVSAVSAVVMDEADRLLDLGFEASIRDIMAALTSHGMSDRHSHADSNTQNPRACAHHRPSNTATSCGDGAMASVGGDKLKRVLVSATITAAVERLSHFALRPRRARVGETEDNFAIPATLRQHFVSVPVKHRLAVLLSFLRAQLDAGGRRIVIFVATADTAEFLYYLVSTLAMPAAWGKQRGHTHSHHTYGHCASREGNEDGKDKTRVKTPAQRARRMTELANRHLMDANTHHAVVTFDDDDDDDDDNHLSQSIGEDADRPDAAVRLASSHPLLLEANVFTLHGNMSQLDRGAVYRAFQSPSDRASGENMAALLFCTDVAARGLDLPAVDWIVHYDPPTEPACYIHRVGRTARIGRSGDSILFLAPHEVGYVDYIHNFVHTHTSHSSSEGTHCVSTIAATPSPGSPERRSSVPLSAGMAERRYETFLFYLTKLDPASNHRWRDCTATLERSICRTVMHGSNHHGEVALFNRVGRQSRGGGAESLERLALFAYQSHLRAYAAMPRPLKRLFFPSDGLHLGHVAQSFGIDESPREVQRRLRGVIVADRTLAREDDSHHNRNHNHHRQGVASVRNDTRTLTGTNTEDEVDKACTHEDHHAGLTNGSEGATSAAAAVVRKRGRVELEHADRYRSSVAQKQRKLTRDWAERRMLQEGAISAPRHNSEFAAS